MKVAITSTGNTLESTLDMSFGRCTYFAIYDTDGRSVEYIFNPNQQAEEGAGTASVHLMASLSVNKIVSGEFGLKTKPLLDSLRIQMIVLKAPGKTIREIIEMLNH
jgi:predicted Fe-Mo cluster-binding NifX family protein